ncbi:hypothetical protein PHYBOEH_010459 [Phytophthora boehmeriae]|uniref:Acyltransferase 3 domain-containing protein n=1 Tax=Phytophthora boehmeriae TaxID=109152 RepID=A0A8T1VRE7_9STRA|nr:hypothetical protein PHYBOEH_010459 [Phytophthora boehmeriae]
MPPHNEPALEGGRHRRVRSLVGYELSHEEPAVDYVDENVKLLVQEGPEAQSSVDTTKQAKSLETASAPTKILFLDGVRGLAAIFVMTQHSLEYMQDIDLGAISVDAFFVLSSFLLTMLFMKKSIRLLEKGASYRKWAFTLADYFSKRFFRVYPLFALTVIVLWMLPDGDKMQYYTLGEPEKFDLFKTLTFHSDQRHFVLWTLPVEIGYYFFIPVFVITMLKMREYWWVSLFPSYAWIMYEGLYTLRWNHQGLMLHAPTFVNGSMAAVIYVKADRWIKSNKFTFRPLHLVVIRAIESVTAMVLLSVAFKGLLFSWVHETIAPHLPGVPFVSVHLTIIIVIEMLAPSCISTTLEWNVLRYWGKISFSVYLLHGFVVYNEAIRSQPSYYDRVFARFGLILLLASVSYHAVERPSQVLAGYITRYLAKQEATRQCDNVQEGLNHERPV